MSSMNRKFGLLFAKHHTPQVRELISRLPHPADVSIAIEYLDLNQATDFVSKASKDLHYGARVRNPGYEEKFPGQFTIRSLLDSGAPTELAKVRKGYMNRMFYGHLNTRGLIYRWDVLDMDVFRDYFFDVPDIRNYVKGKPDGTWFRAYKKKDFPSSLIIETSHPAIAQSEMRFDRPVSHR